VAFVRAEGRVPCPAIELGGFAVDVDVLTDVAQLESAKPEWDALLETSAIPRPFLMHEWLTTWDRHYGGTDGPLVLCFRDNGRLIGVAPFRASRSRLAGIPLLRRVHFPVDAADCRDLLIGQGAEWDVVEALFEWLKTDGVQWDVLRLRGLCSRAPTWHLLPLLAGQAGLQAVAWRVAPCAYIGLPDQMDAYYDQMPSQTRRKRYLQKRRKLIREHGELSLHVVTGAEVTQAHLGRFCEMHCRSWDDRGGSQVLHDERYCRFLVDFSTAIAGKGRQPTLAFLRLGDRDAAAQYGFLFGKRFLLFAVGFDPEFASYSIGGQALLSLIEYGIEQGWAEIDLMKGGERYKFDYTRSCGLITDLAIAKSPAKLRAFCALAALRGVLCS
jgi:CelD/BcsL family acetyltransferase involved in cellulose biosynthesis